MSCGRAREGHGQADPLLLPAGQLVRVGVQDLGHRGQADLGQHLGQPFLARLRAALVGVEDLAQLGAHLQGRVQRAGRVLRHVGDLPAAQPLQIARGQPQDVLAVDEDLTVADDQAPADVAEQGQRHRGLARPGLADQPEHLAGLDPERDLVHHVDGLPAAGRGPQHLQVLDDQPQLDRAVAAGGTGAGGTGAGGAGGAGVGRTAVGSVGGHVIAPAAVMLGSSASSAPRPTPSEARAIASVSVLVPMVRAAMSRTGASTPHGLATRPIRFSLIM